MSRNDEPRRGGRPTERGEVKRSAIAVRTTPTVKDKLTEAAARAGRSLTQEIEQRLERSIEDEDVLGGPGTSAALRALAAEIANVERRTGASWLSDHVTYWAARERVTALLGAFLPEPINYARLVATLDEIDALDRQMDGLIGLLEEVGAVRPHVENALARFATFRRGMFGRSQAMPTLLSEEPDAFPLPSEAYFSLSSELSRRKKVLAIDPLTESKTWVLQENGKQLTDEEKIGIRALVERARNCAEQIKAKRDEVLEINGPNAEAQRKGKALAAALSGHGLINDGGEEG